MFSRLPLEPAARRGLPGALFGPAQIFVRARKLVVKRDEFGPERAGEPKVACVVKRELRSLSQDDGGVEIDCLQRDRKRVEQGKSFEQGLPLAGRCADFFQTRIRDFKSNQAWSVESCAAQLRTISSRVSSLNSSATIADASATLIVTVFPDQPRRFVPPHKTEAGSLWRRLRRP